MWAYIVVVVMTECLLNVLQIGPVFAQARGEAVPACAYSAAARREESL